MTEIKIEKGDAVKAHPGECPFVDRRFVPDTNFNVAITYPTSEGDYIFYDHDDGFGKISRVQFCQLIGRKRDVFECFNESEWKACSHYRSKMRDNEND